MASGAWSQDEAGQWWWHNRTTRGRTRGVLQKCVRCGLEFPAVPSRKTQFCGIQCAAWAPRRKPVYEPPKLDMGLAILGGRRKEPRWAPDRQGIWWEIRDGKAWTRAALISCRNCGKPFPRRPSHRQIFCSYQCVGNYVVKSGSRIGKSAANWQGGRHLDREGYVWILVGREYPRAIQRGNGWYIKEHRKVMAEILGRSLQPWEQVHHINGLRDDNRPENLELWTRPQPAGIRSDGSHCPTCTCFKQTT